MDRRQLLTIVRGGSAVLVVAAIIAQAVELANHNAFDASKFFAYFTIQSNLIGVVAVALLVTRGNAARSRGLELLRGAATVYLTVTFFVVIFLLSGVDVGLQLLWVDVVVHKIFPIILVFDWIIDPPTVRLTYRDALIWLVYPLIWTGFTLIRGAADGWYPYPFLNPANGGYGQVAIIAVAITLGFLVISLAVIALGNIRSRNSPEAQRAG